MHPGIFLAASYVAGSIPAALIAGRAAKGIDLRQHGSGNLGATNVYRVLGARIALAVFLFDVGKGALPVLLFPQWTSAPRVDLWAIAYGVAAIVGHTRPIFLLGKGGGKGVATATGVFLALAPGAALVSFLTFVLILRMTGYVSLGSLVAAVALCLVAVVTPGPASPVFAVAVLVTVFVFWTHRANIRRLRKGEEHRFRRRRPTASDPTVPEADVTPPAQ
ncbi:MAG: glycerol-3-phosphate 1-O-acyltransferase PlsY [Gemmatimonadaceae bacterium]